LEEIEDIIKASQRYQQRERKRDVVGESVAEEGTRISELVSGEALEGAQVLPTAHCTTTIKQVSKTLLRIWKASASITWLFSRATSVRRALLEEHKEEILH